MPTRGRKDYDHLKEKNEDFTLTHDVVMISF